MDKYLFESLETIISYDEKEYNEKLSKLALAKRELEIMKSQVDDMENDIYSLKSKIESNKKLLK